MAPPKPAPEDVAAAPAKSGAKPQAKAADKVATR
jgi:hypothetical protein